jgi:hypothetical protein
LQFVEKRQRKKSKLKAVEISMLFLATLSAKNAPMTYSQRVAILLAQLLASSPAYAFHIAHK